MREPVNAHKVSVPPFLHRLANDPVFREKWMRTNSFYLVFMGVAFAIVAGMALAL